MSQVQILSFRPKRKCTAKRCIFSLADMVADAKLPKSRKAFKEDLRSKTLQVIESCHSDQNKKNGVLTSFFLFLFNTEFEGHVSLTGRDAIGIFDSVRCYFVQ